MARVEKSQLDVERAERRGDKVKLQNQGYKHVTDSRIILQRDSLVNLSLWLQWETWKGKAKQETKKPGNRGDIPYLLLVISFLGERSVVAKGSEAKETGLGRKRSPAKSFQKEESLKKLQETSRLLDRRFKEFS